MMNVVSEQLNPQSTEEIKRNGAEEKQKPNDAVPSPEKSLVKKLCLFSLFILSYWIYCM